jgi:membrane protease YdiL (CAAX protease family)
MILISELTKEINTTQKKIILLSKALILVYVISITSYYTVKLLEESCSIIVNTKQSNESHYDPFTIILSSLIVAPILEEFMCRSVLKPNSTTISIFLASLLIFPFSYLLHVSGNIKILIFALIFPIAYITSKVIFKKYSYIDSYTATNKVTVALLIISSIIFGLNHINRYEEITLTTILLCSPHILTGFIFGYIRLKNGLIWSIILHFLSNLPLVIWLLYILLR